MNLIIDVGNTNVKLATFKKGRLETLRTCISQELGAVLKDVLDNNTIERTIVSSVGHLSKEDFETLGLTQPFLFLDHTTSLPFKNDYSTPQTLGVDRMALVSAAVANFPNQNALVIDAGTCITYDFVTANGHYKGGAISPGMRIRYKALHNLTANLPLLEPEQPDSLVGDSTVSSMHSGVIFGVIKEIEGIITEYQLKNEDLTVILTGGDGKFLSKQLKNSIFANSNFLLEGLNYILEFNT